MREDSGNEDKQPFILLREKFGGKNQPDEQGELGEVKGQVFL